MTAFDIKSIVEIAGISDACKNSSISANAEIEADISDKSRKSDISLNCRTFENLCRCIKFSKEYRLGEYSVYKNDNRILVASAKYSAPVYYRYSCNADKNYYTIDECKNIAMKIVWDSVPEDICGSGKNIVSSSFGSGATHTFVIFCGGNSQRPVTVKIRRDTGNVIFFDARSLYYK